jgi:hypothetical protein
VIHFEDEIIENASEKVCSTALEKAQLNEVTVPTIHFIESSARYDVRVRQIKQSVIANLCYAHIADPVDSFRQASDFNGTPALDLFHLRILWVVEGNIKDTRTAHFDIFVRSAVGG